MTLNLTILSSDAIFQSSDHRLTNADTGKLITDASTKAVSLTGSDWSGFSTYTGIGRWRLRDTSEWVVRWVSGINGSTDEIVELLREEGTGWLKEMRQATGRRHRHTFVFASFANRKSTAWVLSNFGDAKGKH